MRGHVSLAGLTRLAVGQVADAYRSRFPNADVRRDRRDDELIRLLLATALAPDSNCVDVGANIGEVLEHLVRLAPVGRHVAFEPLPDLAARLEARFPTVDVRRLALANRTGAAEYVHVVTRPAFSGLRERSYPGPQELQRLTVEVARLDDVLPRDYRPALIKIDVEGGEREVIAGGLETITRHRPFVVFEHGLGAADYYGTSPEQVYELLAEQAGLRIFDFDGNGPFSRDQFAKVYAGGAIWNYLARP